jgi:hypothetical protein
MLREILIYVAVFACICAIQILGILAISYAFEVF